jgi:hypothetical protein
MRDDDPELRRDDVEPLRGLITCTDAPQQGQRGRMFDDFEYEEEPESPRNSKRLDEGFRWKCGIEQALSA